MSASVGRTALPVDSDGVVEGIPTEARTIRLFSSDGESWRNVALQTPGVNPEEIRLPCGAIEGVVIEPRGDDDLAFQSDSRIEAFRLETPGQDIHPDAVPEASCARFNSLLDGSEEPFRLRGQKVAVDQTGPQTCRDQHEHAAQHDQGYIRHAGTLNRRCG